MARAIYDNQKFMDHHEIMNLMSLRKLSKKYSEDEIMIWCQQLERGPLADVDNFPTYIEIPLEVANSRTLLPCNVHRILDVYTSVGDSSSRIPFSSNGEYLFFHPDLTLESVFIDYVGTPVAEDGTPLILRGHEFACVAFCVYNLYYADMIDDKMSVASRQQLAQEKDNELLAAMSNRQYRNRTRGGSVNNVIITGDMIAKIGNMPLYTKALPR